MAVWSSAGSSRKRGNVDTIMNLPSEWECEIGKGGHELLYVVLLPTQKTTIGTLFKQGPCCKGMPREGMPREGCKATRSGA